jgi:hypothetical protein
MNATEISRLIRLRSMIQSAAEVVPVDGHAAPALTENYSRLRALVREALTDEAAPVDEFEACFPDLPVVDFGGITSARAVGLRELTYAPEAKQAQSLLRQLAGWLEGVLEAAEYRARIDSQP